MQEGDPDAYQNENENGEMIYAVNEAIENNYENKLPYDKTKLNTDELGDEETRDALTQSLNDELIARGLYTRIKSIDLERNRDENLQSLSIKLSDGDIINYELNDEFNAEQWNPRGDFRQIADKIQDTPETREKGMDEEAKAYRAKQEQIKEREQDVKNQLSQDDLDAGFSPKDISAHAGDTSPFTDNPDDATWATPSGKYINGIWDPKWTDLNEDGIWRSRTGRELNHADAFENMSDFDVASRESQTEIFDNAFNKGAIRVKPEMGSIEFRKSALTDKTKQALEKYKELGYKQYDIDYWGHTTIENWKNFVYSNEAVASINNNGGATMNTDSGEIQKLAKGYMVSYKDREKIVDLKDFTPEILDEYRQKNQIGLYNDFIRAWVNDNKVYLDVSHRFYRLDEAQEFGKENNQYSIWDNEKGEAIDLNVRKKDKEDENE